MPLIGVQLDTKNKKNNLMCGIVGYLSNEKKNTQLLIKNMTRTLVHRGPDKENYWNDEFISFGHTRLSIIDLSENGDQPMVSYTGRLIIVFNGEIYNSKEIKKKLDHECQNIKWKGHSDTEIFLNAIDYFGIEKALSLSRGMFSFGLWDKNEKKLFIARDRIGEKPLYYYKIGNDFIFASELKAIKELKKHEFVIDQNAVSMFMQYGYIPAPYSIYKNIFKLEAGKILSVSLNSDLPIIKTWWDVNYKSKSNFKNNISNNENQIIEELESLLFDSVKEQMLADVPIGSMLSGGMDSSLITAIMQKNSFEPINSFTIGFEENDFNESYYAKSISKHLCTSHNELFVTSKQAQEVIPKIPEIYDEPFADSSQIPTYLVSKMISDKVTVSLSGDAGDELFGGYNRYLWASKIWSLIKYMPLNVRKILVNIIIKVGINNFNLLYMVLKFLTFNYFSIPNFPSKLKKITNILNLNSKKEIYSTLVSQMHDNSNLLQKNIQLESRFLHDDIWNDKDMTFEEQMMHLDLKTYLPDDILVKVDRASMANSLETRVPFLDHRVIDFALSLPSDYKIKNNKGKIILRKILNKYLPSHLIDRPKQGFGIPLDLWLKTSLKSWVDDNLFSNFQLDQYLDKKLIHNMWHEHKKGFNNQYLLWNILIFNSWLERWR